jgi:hypothetical protein
MRGRVGEQLTTIEKACKRSEFATGVEAETNASTGEAAKLHVGCFASTNSRE